MALTKFWAEITLDLSDSLIIPFNVNDYAAVLTYAVNQLDDVLQKKAIPNILDNYSTVMVNLKDSVKRFAKVASIMQTLIEEINAGKRAAPLRDIELLNGRLTNLERAFINDRGLYPGRVEARHVLFAASLHDKYSGTMCAGVLDSVGNYMDAKKANDANKADLWLERISITISELQYAIESAILVLDLNSY
uniref:Transferrin receptor-like dimerisation domain-containing protein n=1 Tax=Plectus sambesii TaxID=2011161 RepID=A0A914WEP1_9BILA